MRHAPLALAIALLSTGAARANPADVFGFGARSAAMGGAATAVADDASANYYNPAGLARTGDLRIDVGYQAGKPHLFLNGHDSDVDATHGFDLGLVAPLELFKTRIAFGIGVFLPDDRLTRTRSLPFAQPRWVYYDNRTQRIYFAANLAVRIFRGLYVGAGLTYMAGIAWEATPWLTLAASYRHSFVLTTDQGFSITGNVGNPGMKPAVSNGSLVAQSSSSDLFQPWQLTFGGALRLTRRVLLAYDLTYARWSEFPTPAANFHLTLDAGALNPYVHIPPSPTYPEPGFHDIVIPRIGVEVRALDGERLGLDVRAGYSYEPSPAPEQIGAASYADADKHRFSVGAGLAIKRLGRWFLARVPLAIDASFGVTALPPRANRKASPVDPVGDFVADGYVLEGGVTTRWAF